MKSATIFRPLTFCVDEQEGTPIWPSHIHFLALREQLLLIEVLDSPSRVLARTVGDLSVPTGRRFRTGGWNAKAILDEVRRTERLLTPGVLGCIFYWGSTCPPQLREIFGAPVMLFCRGTLPENQYLLAGIVGTRFPIGGVPKVLGCQRMGLVSGLTKERIRKRMKGAGRQEGVSLPFSAAGSTRSTRPPASRMAALSWKRAEPPSANTRRATVPSAGYASMWWSSRLPRLLVRADYALDERKTAHLHAAGIPRSFGTGAHRPAGLGAAVIGEAGEPMRDWGLEFREPRGKDVRPCESPGWAPARIRKEKIEGACATKAGETFWRI